MQMSSTGILLISEICISTNSIPQNCNRRIVKAYSKADQPWTVNAQLMKQKPHEREAEML